MKSPENRSKLSFVALAALVLTLLVALSFAGCEMASLIPVIRNPSVNDPTLDPEAPGTSAPETTPPVTEPQKPIVRIFHPLTGLETTTELSLSRPVAFSISNTAYALPQFGIGESDILLEFPIENGATRLVMITSNYGQLEKIGAIRSTRPYISDIVNCFDAVQVYAGTSDVSSSVLFEDRDTLDYLTQNLHSLCYRDTSRVMPHNLMTTGHLVSSEMQKLGYRTTVKEDLSLPFGFVEYGKNAVAGSTACSEIQMTFSATQNAKFTYHAASGEYLRYQLGEAQVDGNDGTQISFRNLLVLFSDCATYETSAGIEFALTYNGGTGTYITDGTKQQISWQYSDGMLELYDLDGNRLQINRGSTYIGFMKVTDTNALQVIK